ncbi:unnamed protein product [Calypogeia fissa]
MEKLAGDRPPLVLQIDILDYRIFDPRSYEMRSSVEFQESDHTELVSWSMSPWEQIRCKAWWTLHEKMRTSLVDQHS